jgi:hypothetical protein
MRFYAGIPRARLKQIFEELQPPEPKLSWRTRTDLLLLVWKVLDQGRDPRVTTLPWQIAMLAVALHEQRGAQPKAAIVAAIETYAPHRADDAKFRAFIERTYSKVRSGKNPAKNMLLAPHPDVLGVAAARLPKR